MSHISYLLSINLNRMINSLIRILARILVNIHVLNKMFVVRMDGGICSQMHFFLIGELLARKGYQVKYDIRWFKSQGKDLTGKFARNFDLLKAFPYLKFSVATSMETFFYSRLAANNFISLSEIKPPLYLGGYYDSNKEMYEKLFSLVFKVDIAVLDKENKKVYEQISKNDNTVAIHVRRGDLATFNGAYGKPVGIDYFNHVLQRLYKKIGALNCYLFSDEPQWIKENLLDELPQVNAYTLIDFNGSDKGYMDMFLISACQYQISSKGSLGKFGGFLNDDVDGKIYVYADDVEREKWEGIHSKIEFVK